MEYTASLEPGQVYIPYKMFVGIFVPSALCRYSDLSEGAKLLFGRLALHSGKDGHCNPSQKCLAGELAKSVATIGRWQQELIDARLIRVRRVGSGKSNEFEFLWNPILASSLRAPTTDKAEMRSLQLLNPSSTTDQLSSDRSNPAARVANLRNHDSSYVRNPYKEEKIVSEKMYEKSEFDRSLPKKGRLQENKNSWSQSEIEIVRDLLKPFQTWIKAPLEQDPRTIDLLLKMAARYDIPVQHLRGYLDRIWRRLDRMRARPGDIDGWNYIVKAVRQEICAKKSPELEGTRPVTGPGVQSPIGLVDAESPASGCHNDRVDGKRQHFPSERQQLAQSVMDEQRKESERLTEKAHATLGDPNASKEEREFAREMLGLYRPH